MEGADQDRRNKHPRLLSEPERDKLEEFVESIHYSSRYVAPQSRAVSEPVFSND